MSVTIEEDGRGFTKDTVRRVYVVRGVVDEVEARAALLAKVAADGVNTIGGLVLSNISGDEEARGVFRCAVDWAPFQPAAPAQTGESQFNFELSLQPIKVVVPINTTIFGPDFADDDPPPTLIGDQRTIDPPEGVEVYEPVFEFSETHYLSASLMTLSYRNALGRLVGKMNGSLFKGWDAGEVLSRAVSGSKRGTGDWEVTFRFSCRENMNAATVAGIAGVTKRGWDYLWPYYKLADSRTTLVNTVTHIVVNQVFQTANFAGFGIGT